MDKVIAACGNDCAVCPRHLPKTEEELRRTAQLWMNIGYRDRVVTTREIACEGCTEDTWCRYNVVRCAAEHDVPNCGQCGEYPCGIILQCFETTASFEPSCRANCTDAEFAVMKKAFFEKRENLENT